MLTPGSATSEFFLAKWLGVAGVSLQALAGVMAVAMPGSFIVAIVVAVSGAATAIAGALGYQLPRADLKAREMSLVAAQQVLPPVDGGLAASQQL